MMCCFHTGFCFLCSPFGIPEGFQVDLRRFFTILCDVNLLKGCFTVFLLFKGFTNRHLNKTFIVNGGSLHELMMRFDMVFFMIFVVSCLVISY